MSVRAIGEHLLGLVGGGARERRVLVLRAGRASWTLWRDGRCVGTHVDTLDAPPACPWPTPPETLVDVVADSPLDEIDRVFAATGDDGRTGAARASRTGALGRRLLAPRLARSHPEAAVRLAPVVAAPLLASLLHAELPEPWLDWLERLQRGPVTLRAVHSAIRLFEVPRDIPPEAPAGKAHGDVLWLTGDADEERHLLVRDGCPIFTRLLRGGGADTAREGIDETLAHVAARHGVATASVRRIPTGEGGEACRLAALALATPARAGRGVVPSALLGKARRRRDLRRLRASTGLTVLITVAVVTTAIAHGVDGVRERSRAAAQQRTLAASIESLRERSRALHAEPVRADASLARLDAHAAARAPDAHAVLALLAEALARHPDVHVDRLDWSVEATPVHADRDEVASEPPGRPAELPLRPVPRDADGAVPAEVRIEFGGHVGGSRDGGISLRERQARFEHFVADLDARTGVVALAVLLSPATAASRGDGTVGEGAGDHRVDYGLRLRVAGEAP